jgi:hypothetical protein
VSLSATGPFKGSVLANRWGTVEVEVKQATNPRKLGMADLGMQLEHLKKRRQSGVVDIVIACD